jgi:hypothetical protein
MTAILMPSASFAPAARPLASSATSPVVRAPQLPLLPHYHVVSWPQGAPPPSTEQIDAMWRVAHALARQLGAERFGDEQCFTVLYDGARTRRRPWPHFHIILARTPGEKRRALIALSAKRWLRILWRLARQIVGGAR